MPETSPKFLLRLKEVQEAVGLGSATIYRMMDAGHFPRPRRIGTKSTRWHVDDLREWAASRPEAVVGEAA